MNGPHYKSKALLEKGSWAKDSKLEAGESLWMRCTVKHEMPPNNAPNSAKYKFQEKDWAGNLCSQDEAYEKPLHVQPCRGRKWRQVAEQAQKQVTGLLREPLRTAKGMDSEQRLRWMMLIALL